MLQWMIGMGRGSSPLVRMTDRWGMMDQGIIHLDRVLGVLLLITIRILGMGGRLLCILVVKITVHLQVRHCYFDML